MSLKPKKRKMRISKPKEKRKSPNITYQIVLTNRNNRVNTFCKSKDRNKIINEYEKLLTKSRRVKFPVLYSVLEDVVEADYELLMIRNIGEDSEAPEDRIFEGKFKIIKQEPYNIEETFRIYGKCPVNERMNVDELKEYLLGSSIYHREYGILQNKIVIYNEESFDMIITKCPEDGKRLGRFLYQHLNQGKRFFYRGEYYGGDKPEIVDLISERTGWDRKKINRIKKNS